MVVEKDKRGIKRITPVATIGSIITLVIVDKRPSVVKFDIVYDNYFPIPEVGIIGISFFKRNRVMFNFNKELLIIINNS